MKNTIKTWETTPIRNYINGWFGEIDEPLTLKLLQEEKQVIMAPHSAKLDPVTYAKLRLGTQDYTWNGSEHRFWIWERDNWRLFANCQRGVSVEVSRGLTKEQVFETWSRFLEVWL